jgi:hypothetical protein
MVAAAGIATLADGAADVGALAAGPAVRVGAVSVDGWAAARDAGSAAAAARVTAGVRVTVGVCVVSTWCGSPL